MRSVQKLINLEKDTVQEIEEGLNKESLPTEWPQKGDIDFKNVHLRYRPTTELVLKGLNFKIQAGMKVGVVGRTGAGKSTLGLTLLRLMEVETGNIEIDGIDIRKVELQHLRHKITTIAQEATLFKGTLRFNIDPYESETNENIDALLERAGLTKLLKYEKGTECRNFAIEESGNNLSTGEKQIVCICRAVLRKAKVVIFDEATANIDVVTEHKILDLVKTEFTDATVMTIAHRLNTIINSDMIAVMSYGKLVEYAPPEELLKRPDSEFTKLLNELEAKEQE